MGRPGAGIGEPALTGSDEGKEDMKKYFAAAFVALLAGLTLAATASAEVPRYQIQTATFTVTEPAGAYDQWTNVWTHTYTVTLDNPCGLFPRVGAFTGSAPAQVGPGGVTEGNGEAIVGTFNNDGTISFTATRAYDGRTWTLTNAPMDETTVTVAVTVPSVAPNEIDMKVGLPHFTSSSFRNHGDFVKQAADRADAAHSCVGMPIQNVALTFTAITPKDVYDQWTNVWTHTYLINYNAATHAFSGTGAIAAGGVQYDTETITGTLSPTSISFDAKYVASAPYEWFFNGPFDTETLATDNLGSTHLDVKVTEPVAAP